MLGGIASHVLIQVHPVRVLIANRIARYKGTADSRAGSAGAFRATCRRSRVALKESAHGRMVEGRGAGGENRDGGDGDHDGEQLGVFHCIIPFDGRCRLNRYLLSIALSSLFGTDRVSD